MVRLSKGPESNQNAETPSDFLYAINHDLLAIRFDLAASHENAKAGYYFTEDDNSLQQDWIAAAGMVHRQFEEGILLLNPPFRNIAPWAKKCAETAEHLPLNVVIALLIPTATGANYWRDYIHKKAWIRHLNGRLYFDGKNPFPKDCSLCLYNPRWQRNNEDDIWEWRKSVPDELIIRTKRKHTVARIRGAVR